MADSVEELEARRTRILEELAAVGDMRPGSITECYRPCGKQPCCCKEAGHPGHGPYYSLTFKAGGKTVTRHLAPGPTLSKTRREIAAFRTFEQLVPKWVAVNQAICEARPVEDGQSAERRTLKKNRRDRPGGSRAGDRAHSRSGLAAAAHAAELGASRVRGAHGHARRRGALLEQLLNSERDTAGPPSPAGPGTRPHSSAIATSNSPGPGSAWSARAYSTVPPVGTGLSPKDQELDIVATSFSPAPAD